MAARGVILLLFFAGPASPAWWRAASARFEVFSDLGRSRTAEVAQQLERLHDIFGQSSAAYHLPLPVRVFVFGSNREFARFRPSTVAKGFFQSGPERDYIAVLDTGGETRRALQHEYIHLVLHHSTASLPLWLEEGTAEFYSTLRAEGNELVVGVPVPVHLQVLRRERWLSAAQFFSLDRRSPLRDEAARVGVFYAQSWALTHMLNMVSGLRQHMPRFATLLEDGAPAALAIEQAFGVSAEGLLDRLEHYVAEGKFPVGRVLGGRGEELEAEVLPADEITVASAHAELLVLMNHGKAAAEVLRRLPADQPGTQTALAMLALAEGRDQQAAGHFLKAIELGSTAAAPYFEYGMLLRDQGAPEDKVRPYLLEAAGRNPRHAEAQFLLGLMEQRAGRHREAIARFESAISVLPRQSYFWHALAMSCHAEGDSGRARRAARKSVETARSEQELGMAHAALKLTTAAADRDAPAAPKQTVRTPGSWSPPGGDSSIHGVLEHVDCLGASARFHVRGPDGVIPLWVQDPGQVLLNTESAITFTLTCGPQPPRQVRVGYKAQPDAKRRTQGVIVAIDFLN
jgi:tetratricopeptide (TPR) repeat protein